VKVLVGGISEVERDSGKKFYYITMGYETHGKPSFRLWVSPKLIKEDEKGWRYVQVNGSERRIFKTEKGNYVLKPARGWNVFRVGWECGYRGSSEYEILTPLEEDELVLPYYEYRSPRGSLGVSEYALVSTKKDRLKVLLTRTGRTYGAPKKMYVEYSFDENGEQIETELPPEEDEELLKELEE